MEQIACAIISNEMKTLVKEARRLVDKVARVRAKEIVDGSPPDDPPRIKRMAATFRHHLIRCGFTAPSNSEAMEIARQISRRLNQER